jgi:cephalosporin hydroxylase
MLIVMDLYTKNRWRLRRAAPAGQRIAIVDGDTTHPLTVVRLRRKLKEKKLDLLLIDGDHRWRGVRSDFLTYRQFVRDGGLIAFHDICAISDHRARAWTGDVPAFWKVVRSIYQAEELISASGQQGLGIGVIRYDSAASVAPILEAVGV